MKAKHITAVMFILTLAAAFAAGCGRKEELNHNEIDSVSIECEVETTEPDICNNEHNEEAKEQETKTNEEIADEVIVGLWGVGDDRIKKLTDAGYNPNEVQEIVDKRTRKTGTTYFNSYYERAVSYEGTGCVYSGDGQKIADMAWGYVGWLPYISGGADLTSGVDCTGFTMCLYAMLGYSLPHAFESQIYCGISVPLECISPGDIVVYSGHVGIYVGADTVIHAPQPGECVKASSLYMMTIYDIRRIVY